MGSYINPINKFWRSRTIRSAALRNILFLFSLKNSFFKKWVRGSLLHLPLSPPTSIYLFLCFCLCLSVSPSIFKPSSYFPSPDPTPNFLCYFLPPSLPPPPPSLTPPLYSSLLPSVPPFFPPTVPFPEMVVLGELPHKALSRGTDYPAWNLVADWGESQECLSIMQ